MRPFQEIEAIIVAGGKGRRIGQDKLYVPLRGKPIIFYTIEAILALVPSIILVVSEERLNWWKENNRYRIKKIVVGGKERQDSVHQGLKSLNENIELVLIHDGARPFVSKELIERVILSAKEYKAVVPGVKSKATVKTVKDGWAINTLNREYVWLIQTPQCFERELIVKSYEKAYNEGFYGTDCASIVEKGGFKIKVIPGDERNIKITTQFDLELANFLARYL